MAEQVYGASSKSHKGERSSSSWIQQVRNKLSHVLHRGESRFSREGSSSPRRKMGLKSLPQIQVCLRENLYGDLTATSASESEDAPLDLRTYNIPRLRKELHTLSKTCDQLRKESPTRRRDCKKRGWLERIIQSLPRNDPEAAASHGFSVSVSPGTASRPPPYCNTQIPLIESIIYDDDDFLYVSRQGGTMPEMRSLMKQAAQRGDDTTVTAIAHEMEETFGEYQNGLSSIERKRRMELTSRVGKSRAHASSGISKGVRKGLGLGLNPPLSLLFYKTLLPAQRRLLFSHTFVC